MKRVPYTTQASYGTVRNHTIRNSESSYSFSFSSGSIVSLFQGLIMRSRTTLTSVINAEPMAAAIAAKSRFDCGKYAKSVALSRGIRAAASGRYQLHRQASKIPIDELLTFPPSQRSGLTESRRAFWMWRLIATATLCAIKSICGAWKPMNRHRLICPP